MSVPKADDKLMGLVKMDMWPPEMNLSHSSSELLINLFFRMSIKAGNPARRVQKLDLTGRHCPRDPFRDFRPTSLAALGVVVRL